MSEWNLSVRLTGQGSDLASTLRDSAKEARKLKRRIKEARQELALLRAAAADDITVRLDVDAAHLRSDVTDALSAAGSGQGLGVRLDIDAAHLRDDVNAALTRAGDGQSIRIRLDLDADHLRSEVTSALTTAGAGQGLAVNLRLGNAMQLRREVEDAVRWAAWGHRIEIPIGLRDPMQLRRDVSDAVRWASMSQTITVRVTPDTSALRGLGSSIGGGSGGGANFGLAGLLPIATAAIPLIAGLAATLAPLAGILTATGGAATAFGVALAGQIGPLKEAAEAEKAYKDAVRDHGAASAEAAEAQLAYQRQIAALPPETQKAAAALSNLKTQFGDWSDDMAAFTMEPVTKSFAILQELLPHLSPQVESFSGSMDRLLDVAGGAISTPGFDALSDKVAALTDSSLDSFTDQVIHLLRVVSEGGSTDGALGQILDYARENGPEARAAIDAIGDAISTLAAGAAEAGPSMLTLVTAVANLVAALPPELVGILLQVAAGLKLIQLAGLGAAAVSGAVGRLSTSIATLGATSAAAGGGIAGFRAAVASLSAGARFGAAAAGIAAIVFALHELSDNKPAVQVDELSTSLNTLISTGKTTGVLSTNLDEMAASIAMVSKGASDNKLAQWTSDFGTWVGIAEGPGISTAKKNIDAWDQSMANLVKSGNLKQAKEQYDLLVKLWKTAGGDMGELKEATTGYTNALADHKFEQEMAAQSQGIFGEAAQQTASKLEAQKASADGLRQAIVALNDVNRAAGSAMSAFEQSIDDATAAAKEHGSALRMRDGELDLGSQKARDAEEVLSALAANTDAAATAAREQGRSWEYVTGIQERGKAAFVDAASAMGLSKAQAEALASSYLKIPDSKTTTFEMRTEDAIVGLESVISAIKRTPGSKSVTVNALTSDAVALLEELGFTVTRLPNGKFTVTANTATAKERLAAVQAARDALKNKTITISARDAASQAARAAAAAIAAVKSKQVTITARYRTIGIEGTVGRNNAKMNGYAQGGIVDYYAKGGIRAGNVSFFANGSDDRPDQHQAQIAPAGSYRVWGERETQGEGYVPFRRSARPRSRRITEEIVSRLGGDPRSIDWYAEGGISNWQYDPVSGSLYSPSDAIAAGKKTKKVKGKEVEYFDLAAVEKKLWKMGEATVAWNRNLEKVADRAGGDVARALASMGDEGMALAAKMAKGTDKYVASMSIALRRMMQEARAQLSDFTEQLDHATGSNRIFQDNLAKLAAMGYGDLASHLAGKGDQASMELAAEAAKSPSKAKKANDEVKQAKAQLTPDEMSKLIEIIAAITNKNVGIHQVADKTGLGEDEIIEVGNKSKTRLHQLLGGKAARFLSDLIKANKGQAYENGGIRAGLYATQGGIVRFAEPSTRGEAYIPLGQNKRGSATRVLGDVASRFGLGLTDGQAGRVVVIREQGPLVGESHFHIGDRQSDRDLARTIETRQGYQLRRLARGGVGARG
ncbi:putative phage tail (plasmid) [Streptomyces ambofaciens ATCC 23877]|uniref:Putative phage tail n=1 Tax=Streptomyces ambofaciens (strain ATCC 23877 / 3486 / DSM 40053 / JCM 4204 / NBRC 12836 / NRRL B-2516) TaxID=278992 RepID=A0A0K2B6H7_STRA7|nr:hypothetical protein [Streptomyces ambofaciens]AKZ60828.1 putative phage tail [Streptomyces ambofaciens ATCC 23877]